MILRLALRSLLAHPIRSAVLAGGFGLGVARHGRAARDRRRDPRTGARAGAGRRRRRRHRRRDRAARRARGSSCRACSAPARSRAGSRSPRRRVRANLYLIDAHGSTPVRARGGIPSLERALGDPETRGQSRLDRYRPPIARGRRPIRRRGAARDGSLPPDPRRAGARGVVGRVAVLQRPRNGRALLPDVPRRPARRLPAGASLGVRLQLERGGRMTSYAASTEVDERELLATRAGPRPSAPTACGSTARSTASRSICRRGRRAGTRRPTIALTRHARALAGADRDPRRRRLAVRLHRAGDGRRRSTARSPWTATHVRPRGRHGLSRSQLGLLGGRALAVGPGRRATGCRSSTGACYPPADAADRGPHPGLPRRARPRRPGRLRHRRHASTRPTIPPPTGRAASSCADAATRWR